MILVLLGLVMLVPAGTRVFFPAGQEKVKIINIGILVDVDSSRATLLKNFVEDLPYTDRLYFVIMEWDVLKDDGSVQFMKSRGEIIPAFSYLQTYTPKEREVYVDHYLEVFRARVGSYPKGIFTFQPDTYAANYLQEKYGVSYVMGYAFDQYLIDYMSMRGGWQAPYYASRENIMVPSARRGLVVLPHLTWDWIARYSLNHGYNTHPQNSYLAWGGNAGKALQYMKALIQQTLDGLDPFGYVMVGFEFKRMGLDAGILGMIREYYSWILGEAGGEVMTPSQTVEWFNSHYDGTPEYRISFQSPASGEWVEWLFNTKHRIARSGILVKSFIDYSDQKRDPYLDEKGFINFYQNPTFSNQIDTSLAFKIDGLGGGVGNPYPRDQGIIYLGPLTLFPLFLSTGPIHVVILAVASAVGILVAARVSRSNGILHRKALTSILAATVLLAPTLQMGLINLQRPQAHIEGIKDEWLYWAEIAWRYFQPGVGVNRETGLHYANRDWLRFTDWDLGTYILAVLDVEALGILPTSGEWGANYRLAKVLHFLNSRPLTPEGYPYLVYDSTTGLLPPEIRPAPSNPSDAGRLLLALYKLKKAKPYFTPLIEQVMNRTNFQGMASDPSLWRGTSGFYAYLAAQGFKLWGLDKYQPVRDALNELYRLSKAPTVNVSGVKLPKAWITSEPFIHGMLELEYDPLLADFTRRVYEAMEARYAQTGRLTAWSEGSNIRGADGLYVYQWIVMGDGSTWVVWSDGKVVDVEPAVFTKVAFAMHALYNTPYTTQLVSRVLPLATESGFIEGFRETDGIRLATIFGLRPIISDKTNGIIISAARYALTKRGS
jgi:hypothetical protein